MYTEHNPQSESTPLYQVRSGIIMALEASMFDEHLNTIRNFFRAGAFRRYVVRIWKFQNRCAVADFAYKNIKFAFDFTPLPSGAISLDLVQRVPSDEFRVTSSGQNKERLASEISLDEALHLADRTAEKIAAKIDGIANSETSGLGESVISLEEVSSQRRNEKKSAPLKIGVMTLALNENVGGNLQAYALMQVLRQLGHSPALINRRPLSKGSAISGSRRVDDNDDGLMPNVIGMAQDAPTRPFIEKYITPITRRFASSSELSDYVDRYSFDAIIVGSDQIWRPKYARSLLMDLFLQFLPRGDENTKRISYAASFGAPRWEFDEKQTEDATRLIKEFDAVSVREDSAVALCRKHLGVKAEHVLDPTLLLDSIHYVDKFSLGRRPTVNNKLLAYVLDRSEDKARLIAAVSKHLSLEAYNTKNQPFFQTESSEHIAEDNSVEGWLSSFHEASCVVTDSFHGVVFSIIFNKPFIAYGNPSRGLARFTSLLKMFRLEKRLIVKSDENDLEKLLEPINWRAVNVRLQNLRKKSIDFLVSALSGDELSAKPLSSPAPTVTGAVGFGVNQDIHSSPVCRPLNVLCSGCGVCVSESKGTLTMEWDNEGFLVPQAKSKSIPLTAIKVCPFNPHPDKDVRDEDALGRLFLPDADKFDLQAGRFSGSYIGYSKKYRPSSSSGGIATYIFDQLLKRGVVDYLFVVQSDGANGYKYKVFDKEGNIRNTSKTRYIPVSLDELFSVIKNKGGRVAVSGVACFIKAIRLKQHYHPELRERIPFLVGIICGGLKSRYYTDYLAQSAGIDGVYTDPNYRVKDPKRSSNDYSFSAIDEHSQVHEIKMHRLGDMWGTGLFKARACDFCTDVLTELADISLGDAWLPEYKSDGMGNSVIVTRSALADKIIRSGLESGDLLLDEVPIARISRSQGGGFRHKRMTVKFRVWGAKHFSTVPTPVVRARLLSDLPVSEALIQVRRERARSKSLLYWKATRNAAAFRKRMRATLEDLKAATAERKEVGYDPLSLGRPMSRWLMRKMTARQLNFDMLRSVLERGLAKESTDKEKPR